MVGSLDSPNELNATGHIFVESAGDYYDLNDGLPQSLRYEPSGMKVETSRTWKANIDEKT